MAEAYDIPFPFTELSDRFCDDMDAPIQLIDGPEGDLYNGRWVSVRTLADRAYQHPIFGLHMQHQKPRYMVSFDNAEVLHDVIGPNAHPLGHQYETGYYFAWVTSQLGDDIRPKDQEYAIGLLACLVHDMGESEHKTIERIVGGTIGDIQTGQKTSNDKELERKINKYFYQEVFPDVHPSVIRRLEEIVSHDKEDLLHSIYEAAHVLQGLDTCINALWYDPALDRGVNYLQSDSCEITDQRIDSFLKNHPWFESILEAFLQEKLYSNPDTLAA